MVGIATAAIMLISGVIFGINKAKWMNIFEHEKKCYYTDIY